MCVDCLIDYMLKNKRKDTNQKVLRTNLILLSILFLTDESTEPILDVRLPLTHAYYVLIKYTIDFDTFLSVCS